MFCFLVLPVCRDVSVSYEAPRSSWCSYIWPWHWPPPPVWERNDKFYFKQCSHVPPQPTPSRANTRYKQCVGPNINLTQIYVASPHNSHLFLFCLNPESERICWAQSGRSWGMLEINFLKLTMQATKKRVEEDGWLGTEATGYINNIRLTSCYKHIIRSAMFTLSTSLPCIIAPTHNMLHG